MARPNLETTKLDLPGDQLALSTSFGLLIALPATERLYYNDSHLIEFEARVTDKTERVSGWTAVTLDRTAFYPTGGGQPSDTGTLNGLRVVECIETMRRSAACDSGPRARSWLDRSRKNRLVASFGPHPTTHGTTHFLAGFGHDVQCADTKLSGAGRIIEIDVDLADPTV